MLFNVNNETHYVAFYDRLTSEFQSPCAPFKDLFDDAKEDLEFDGYEFTEEELNKLKKRLFFSLMGDAFDVISSYRSKDDCPDPSQVNLVHAMGLCFADEHALSSAYADEAVIHAEDMDELFGKLDDLQINIGRILVHGEINNDSYRDIAANIVSDVRHCLLAPLAKQLFPDQYQAMTALDFSESVFPDDDDPSVQEAYEEAGFARK